MPPLTGLTEQVKSAQIGTSTIKGDAVVLPTSDDKNHVASINASDKQMEVAFKTNDVFSSQDDMDELPQALLMNSPPMKSGNKIDRRRFGQGEFEPAQDSFS